MFGGSPLIRLVNAKLTQLAKMLMDVNTLCDERCTDVEERLAILEGMVSEIAPVLLEDESEGDNEDGS